MNQFDLEALEPRLLLSSPDAGSMTSFSVAGTEMLFMAETVEFDAASPILAGAAATLSYHPQAPIDSLFENTADPAVALSSTPPENPPAPDGNPPPPGSAPDGSGSQPQVHDFLSAIPRANGDQTASAATQPLSEELQAILRDADRIAEAVQLTAQINNWIFNEMFARGLPIVGSNLKDFADTNELLRISAALDSALQAIKAIDDPITAEAVQGAIVSAFGPRISGDFTVQFDGDVMLLDLNLGGQLFNGTVNSKFDLGLPGLPLDFKDAKVQVSGNYDLALRLRVDAEGFYLETNEADELRLALSFDLPNFNQSGQLAFLQLTATNRGSATVFQPTIRVDLMDDPNDPDTKLLAFDPVVFGAKLGGTNDGEPAVADLQLHTVADFAGEFLKLEADLHLNWEFRGETLDRELDSLGNPPVVEFLNVKLDLASFFSEFLGPIATTLEKVLKPIQPILEVLEKRMPVLSDIQALRSLFDGDGNNVVTLLELLEVTTQADLTFIKAVLEVSRFVETVSLTAAHGGIALGNYRVGGPNLDLRTVPGLTMDDLIDLGGAEDALAKLKSSGASQFAADYLEKPGLAGFSLPIITNPKSALGLFLGEDVTLMSLDLPALDAEYELREFFPLLGPLGVTLSGSIGLTANFDFGFDTFGLRQFSESVAAGKPDAGLILDSFYVESGNGKELTLSASVKAFGSVNVVVAEAGVGGGIKAAIEFDLKDPDRDGKVRLNELKDNFLKGPACIFEVSGKLTAGLEAYIRIGISPFEWEDSYEIATITLLDFSWACDGASLDPDLAVLQADGTLRLNMGPYAAARVEKYEDLPLLIPSSLKDDVDERFEVKHLRWDEATQTETVRVMYNGYFDDYEGVRKIYAEGGG